MSKNFRQGFTIIELLIVIAVSAMLMSIVIFYSRSGERQILLLKEQARLINTILRSKSLTVQTFFEDPSLCGYGVHLENRRYILFKDLAADCSASDRIYSGVAENIQIFKLEDQLEFVSLSLTDILFIPPDPITVLTPDQSSALITIALSTDQNSFVKIKINNAGQVTTQ